MAVKTETTSFIIENGSTVLIEEAGDGHANEIYNNVLNQDEIEIATHDNYGTQTTFHI